MLILRCYKNGDVLNAFLVLRLPARVDEAEGEVSQEGLANPFAIAFLRMLEHAVDLVHGEGEGFRVQPILKGWRELRGEPDSEGLAVVPVYKNMLGLRRA